MTPARPRPVFVCGENPIMSLFEPETGRLLVVVSFWNVTLGPAGAGMVLIVWTSEAYDATENPRMAGVYSDNEALARILVERLTQFFPEFRQSELTKLDYRPGVCGRTSDGESRYSVTCQSDRDRLAVTWQGFLDQKQVLYPDFPIGDLRYDLTTVICPCRQGSLAFNGVILRAVPKVEGTGPGGTSSAFVAYSETWVGPV
jgi:hypothetical protein